MDTAADSRPLTSIDLIRDRARTGSTAVATFHRSSDGVWTPTTWQQLWDEIWRAATALQNLGLRRGERLAIMSHTCREWQIAEFAAALVGAVVVGVDTHAGPDQIAFILRHARAAALVADDAVSLNKISRATLEQFKFVLLFHTSPDGSEARPGVAAWPDVVAATSIPVTEHPAPSPDDIAVLIFTSGTTGEPKGIEYSHRQVMTACWAMVEAYASLAEGRLVCWLPMSALFQRMMNLVAFGHGSATYFVDDPREIMMRLPEIRPTALTSVPRFYERVHDGIRAQLENQSGIRKRLADAALRIGERWSRTNREGKRPSLMLRIQHTILDALVLRRIRAAMGGELEVLISGSAAIPAWLLDFFFSIGLPVLEAYGVTENPLPIAANTPENSRPGSVGRPFGDNLVRLSEDGEVLVKGPTLFRGYLGETLPGDRFTQDGFYRTGDYGRFDADGYLYLTGRIADIIKTSGGRRIAPAGVEAVYSRSRYVEQVLVVGHNRPHLAALIFPNWPAIRSTLGLKDDVLVQTAADSDRARELITSDFARLGAQLASYERLRAFALVPAAFSIQQGELTPTLKLRRAHIESAYHDLIERMYAGSARLVTAAP